MNIDKAGKNYWDSCWLSRDIPNLVNPYKQGLDNYVNRHLHNYCSKIFHGLETSKMKLLEIGCANSVWLPYFTQEFGFKISGIDYSEIGCNQSKNLLEKLGLEHEIICENFFSPLENLWSTFDVVVSFGVVEHFEDTQACLSAFYQFLKPNGMLITSIPNMNGLTGFTQKLFNQPIFDIHVPLDLDALVNFHQKAGFEIIDCHYFLPINFGVINLNGLETASLQTRLKSSILCNLCRLSKVVWAIDENAVKLPTTKFFSPYILVVGKKK